jgi:hypothetical protein
MSKSSSKQKLEVLKSWRPISLKDIKMSFKNNTNKK